MLRHSVRVPKRRALVVASQCALFGELDGLPAAAGSLYGVLTDPRLGGCAPALPGAAGLVLDPTLEDLQQVLGGAFTAADEDGATLVLALIGHGVAMGEDFYFLPLDAAGVGDSRRDLHLSLVLKEQLRSRRNVDGLVVLLDTCHAGVGAQQAAERWAGLGLGAGTRRYELLAATDSREAFGAAFTRALVDLLRAGRSTAGVTLDSNDLAEPLLARCAAQRPQRMTHDGGGFREIGDPGLFLA